MSPFLMLAFSLAKRAGAFVAAHWRVFAAIAALVLAYHAGHAAAERTCTAQARAREAAIAAVSSRQAKRAATIDATVSSHMETQRNDFPEQLAAARARGDDLARRLRIAEAARRRDLVPAVAGQAAEPVGPATGPGAGNPDVGRARGEVDDARDAALAACVDAGRRLRQAAADWDAVKAAANP